MDSAINFKNHLVTDEWNVEIDGKTYWVTRKRRAESPDRDSGGPLSRCTSSRTDTPKTNRTESWTKADEHGSA